MQNHLKTNITFARVFSKLSSSSLIISWIFFSWSFSSEYITHQLNKNMYKAVQETNNLNSKPHGIVTYANSIHEYSKVLTSKKSLVNKVMT
jgi:hypothetical protein